MAQKRVEPYLKNCSGAFFLMIPIYIEVCLYISGMCPIILIFFENSYIFLTSNPIILPEAFYDIRFQLFPSSHIGHKVAQMRAF